MINTPVLLIVFNRPELTSKILDQLKVIQPKFIYVAADGPRQGNSSDAINCSKTREVIEKGITWDCTVKTLYRDTNLGCGKAVSKAITWFFENVEMGIVLEDDCLPNKSFFEFCSILLEKYKHNFEIMHIGGTNFQNGISRGASSYYFSSTVHVWGWATWKRAWDKYRFDILNLDEFIANQKLNKYYSDKTIIHYWYEIFRQMSEHKIDTWDYQWVYTVLNSGGLSIVPQKNMISNIGFGENATHTHTTSEFANMPVYELGEIIHPNSIVQNKEADVYTSYHHFKIPPVTFFQRVKGKIKRILGS